MTAYIIVRAEVAEADRAAFDRWYGDEHLPDARSALAAVSAWRGWSAADPGVHLAFYEFADADQARAALDSAEMAAMRAEFDRVWQDRVRRTRDVVEVAQAI